MTISMKQQVEVSGVTKSPIDYLKKPKFINVSTNSTYHIKSLGEFRSKHGSAVYPKIQEVGGRPSGCR